MLKLGRFMAMDPRLWSQGMSFEAADMVAACCGIPAGWAATIASCTKGKEEAGVVPFEVQFYIAPGVSQKIFGWFCKWENPGLL